MFDKVSLLSLPHVALVFSEPGKNNTPPHPYVTYTSTYLFLFDVVFVCLGFFPPLIYKLNLPEV